jgi:hypothetical protein
MPRTFAAPASPERAGSHRRKRRGAQRWIEVVRPNVSR